MKSFIKKKPASGEMALQITSMADIFMILLLFLLKSSSVAVNSLAPTTRMMLPSAGKASSDVKDTVKLEISNDSILIDQKFAHKLVNFEFSPEDVDAAGRNEKIYSTLFEQRKLNPVPNLDSQLIVMADEETPYSTLKTVFASASAAGFVDLHLVVMEAE